jgi:hypothetical protein
VVWDDTSGTNIKDKWDGAWPSAPTNTAYNTNYRAPQRGIPLPHNRITKYIAGAHYPGTDSDAGYTVMFWKSRTIASYPAYTYTSWYQRIDDNWQFGLGSPADNNIKMWDYSIGTEPYNANNWYLEYNPTPGSRSAIPTWHINDDGASLREPDAMGSMWWWANAVNPMSGAWTKIEQEIKYSNQSDGYIKLWENGVLKINYVGPTDRYPGNDRTESIGGYARSQGSANNWRYFADVYLDYTRARVVLANSVNLSAATIIETQIPSNWSDTSITFTANLGKFTSGQTAYLFVVDSSGLRNSAGYRVVLP